MGDAAPPVPPITFSAADDALMQGATVRPRYVERNPPMWAVGETDMDGLSIASTVSTVAFAIASFLLGVAANILVCYGGVDNLTEVAKFMLYKLTFISGFAALVFYGAGAYMLYRKGTLWAKIKSESRQITPQ
jgi:hypothetical protein